MKRTISTLVASAIGLGLLASPAHADVTVSQQVANRPDSGSFGTWARDTFKRTVTIRDIGGDQFSVKLADAGTFTTIKAAPSPKAGTPMTRALTGTFTGSGTYTVDCADPCRVKTADERAFLPGFFDDADGVQVTTANWAKQFFKGPVTDTGIVGWSWTYSTADETHTQSEQNGQSGDITGRLSSVLKAANKCRVSKTDKRNRWTVSSVQGDRARQFGYAVTYNGVTSAKKYATVNPGASLVVTTPNGGTLKVTYYDGYGVAKTATATSKASILC